MSGVPGDDLAELRGVLTTHGLGRTHEHYASISSTSDRASQWMREGAPHGALVTADAQTAGRGRLGRPWSSPIGGGIYASLGLRPGALTAPIGALGLAVGAGLRAGLVSLPGLAELAIELKWPNDLVVGHRKLGGILCESRWQDGVPELVVGFGVNLGATALEGELAQTATCLASLVPAAALPRRVELLAALLAALEPMLERFWAGGFAAIRGEYEPHCSTLAQVVDLPTTRPDGSRERTHARVVALEEDGALRVRSLAGGPTFRVESADVGVHDP